MSSDSKAIFEAIQYARGEKGMPEKGDPMYWDDAIGRVRFRSVKIIHNWLPLQLNELEDIFSTFIGAFCCRFLMRCLFVCLHDDNDDEKSDARFNSLSLSLSFSRRGCFHRVFLAAGRCLFFN